MHLRRLFSTHSSYRLVVKYSDHNSHIVNAVVNSQWRESIVEKEHNPILGQHTMHLNFNSDIEHDTVKTILGNTGVFCFTDHWTTSTKN